MDLVSPGYAVAQNVFDLQMDILPPLSYWTSDSGSNYCASISLICKALRLSREVLPSMAANRLRHSVI